MVARMRCKASGGREARSAVGLVEAAYPLPPFPHFHRSVMAGPWDQLSIRGCVRRTGGAGLLSGHGEVEAILVVVQAGILDERPRPAGPDARCILTSQGAVGVDVDIDGLEISKRGGALAWPPIRHQT